MIASPPTLSAGMEWSLPMILKFMYPSAHISAALEIEPTAVRAVKDIELHQEPQRLPLSNHD